jgi:hypothetical protein
MLCTIFKKNVEFSDGHLFKASVPKHSSSVVARCINTHNTHRCHFSSLNFFHGSFIPCNLCGCVKCFSAFISLFPSSHSSFLLDADIPLLGALLARSRSTAERGSPPSQKKLSDPPPAPVPQPTISFETSKPSVTSVVDVKAPTSEEPLKRSPLLGELPPLVSRGGALPPLNAGMSSTTPASSNQIQWIQRRYLFFFSFYLCNSRDSLKPRFSFQYWNPCQGWWAILFFPPTTQFDQYNLTLA